MKKYLLLSISALSLTFSCAAQNWHNVMKGTAADRGENDEFGSTVAISGDYAIIGASAEDEDTSGTATLSGAGSAYIFKLTGGVWKQQQKLVADDRAVNDNFGNSVAISGDYAVVGAPAEDQDASGANTMSAAGSAYIFKRTNGVWMQQQKIVATDRAVNDNFGNEVAISGDYIVIGATAEDEDAEGDSTLSNAGSAYVFKQTGGVWAQQQKIVPTDRTASDFFGHYLAIEGDYIIAGVPSDAQNTDGSDTLYYAGSAYIFKQAGGVWNQQQKIIASDREVNASFGNNVSISGDYVIVGSGSKDYIDPSDSTIIPNVGAAYVFKQVGGIWTEEQKLLPTDINSTSGFGKASVSDNIAIIGSSVNAAYIFKQSGGVWTQQNILTPGHPVTNDLFGTNIAISGNNLIIGSKNEDEDEHNVNTLDNSGAVYFFTSTDCPATLTLEPQPGIEWGWLARVTSTGTAPLTYSWNWGDGSISAGANASHTYNTPGYKTVCVNVTDAGGCADTYCVIKPGVGIVNATDSFPLLQSWQQLGKVCAADRDSADGFGYAIAISGDYAITLAPYDDEDANGGATLKNAGAAYILKKTGGVWAQQQKIVAADRDTSNYFGGSVAIYGDYAVVGVSYEGEDALGGNTMVNAGAVYVYKQSGGVWTQHQKIVAADRGPHDAFGSAVAIDGDNLVIGAGADRKDENGLNPFSYTQVGSAYIFKLSGGMWVQHQKIVANDRVDGNIFGSCLALNGDYLVIGDAYNSGLAGAIYVFTQSNGIWTQQQKLFNEAPEQFDRFGSSIAISGNYIISGCPFDDQDANGGGELDMAGSAHIFKQTNGVWEQKQILVNPDRIRLVNQFGGSVSISGNYALVGSSAPIFSMTKAHLFKLSGDVWTLHQVFTDPDTNDDDNNYGNAVAVNGNDIIICAYNEDEDVNDMNTLNQSGALYYFTTRCNAGFTLYPDTAIAHNWFALNTSVATAPATYSWNWGDGSTSTGSNLSHTYSAPGYYNICVTVTGADSCSDTWCDSSTYVFKAGAEMITINVVDQLPNGIEEEENNFIKVYPNPAASALTIELKNTAGSKQLTATLYDITGKVLQTRTANQTRFTMDISSLSKGIYILNVFDGEKQVNKKIIKE